MKDLHFRKKKAASFDVEMSAINVVNNSKFFRSTSRRNSTSSVNMVNATLMNNFVNSNNLYNVYPRTSLNGSSKNQKDLNSVRLSLGSNISSSTVRRCQSMRQSNHGLFDLDDDLQVENNLRYRNTVGNLSTRRSSQIDGGYHSHGSLTSSDSYSSYTKFNDNKIDNPLSFIRINLVDDLVQCLDNVYRVYILGMHNVGKSSMMDQFRECQAEQMSPTNNSSNIYYINLNLNKADIGQFLDDMSIKTQSDSFEDTDSSISNYPADVYVVMYAVNDRDSFNESKYILKEISKNEDAKTKPVILVANKTDLVRGRTINSQEGKQLAIDYGCKYIETSCTISHNVHLLLGGIAAQLNPRISKFAKKSKKSSFFRKLLKKASLNKSKSCHDLHVF